MDKDILRVKNDVNGTKWDEVTERDPHERRALVRREHLSQRPRSRREIVGSGIVMSIIVLERRTLRIMQYEIWV